MTPGFSGTRSSWDPSASARDRVSADEGLPKCWRERGRHPFCPFSRDPSVARSGVLPGQPEDDRHRARRNAPALRTMRSGPVAAEDGNLVAEHDDLNCQITTVTPTQAEQLEDSDEGEVQK